MIISRWWRMVACSWVFCMVSEAGCLAGDSCGTNTVALLMGSERSPGVAHWTFGPLMSNGMVTFKVEWGGCTTQHVQGGLSLGAPGQAMMQRPGEPQLPAVATLLTGIRAGGVRVQSCAPDPWQLFSNVTVAPVGGEDVSFSDQGPSRQVVGRQDPRIYQADTFWPESLVKVQEIWKGTQRLVRVECRLLQYNAVQHRLRVTPQIHGKLAFETFP